MMYIFTVSVKSIAGVGERSFLPLYVRGVYQICVVSVNRPPKCRYSDEGVKGNNYLQMPNTLCSATKKVDNGDQITAAHP